jgi:Uma2 family endonuclease
MAAVVLGDDEVVIPTWVSDQESFLRWACSDEYPQQRRISYYKDRVRVDLEMEADDHNELKLEIGAVLHFLIKRRALGRYYAVRMMLSHPGVGLSTEPDGMFTSKETLASGRAVLRMGRPDRRKGVVVQGTPDMVLEVVSPTSVRKDTVDMLDLYWRAGIREYWLVDPRGSEPRLTLYKRTTRGYRVVRPVDSWHKSAVFGAAFRLVQSAADPNLDAYNLEVRERR